jgi:hypothetical protein
MGGRIRAVPSGLPHFFRPTQRLRAGLTYSAPSELDCADRRSTDPGKNEFVPSHQSDSASKTWRHPKAMPLMRTSMPSLESRILRRLLSHRKEKRGPDGPRRTPSQTNSSLCRFLQGLGFYQWRVDEVLAQEPDLQLAGAKHITDYQVVGAGVTQFGG